MQKKTIISFLFALILLVSCLTGCSSDKAQNGTDENQAVINENIKIETPYGNLCYPYSFEEIVKYESKNDGDVSSYIFYAALDGQDIKIYTIAFSGKNLNDAGAVLGTVKDASGNTVYVYFAPEDEIVNDGMTDGQKNTVYAAQETVNDVIASLNNLSTFTPANN